MNFLGHSRISMEIDIKTMYGNFTGDFYKNRVCYFGISSYKLL